MAVLDPNVWGGYSPSPGMDNGVCPWAGSGRVTASQGWPFPECLKTFRGIDYRSVQQNAMVLIMYLHISLNNASINSVYLLIAFVFNSCLDQGYLPPVWLSANVTPVFKKGDPMDPQNYRPIALTCTLCKVMESVIKQHLLTYLTYLISV